MPNDYFQFKQFTIRQARSAMRVGTDGVLLGAWADARGASRILDIGAGTGLIAIMLAQRSQAMVDAVEIDHPSYLDALDNISRCPWPERLRVAHASAQDYARSCGVRYDLIVSNPPYFVNSLPPAGAARTAARHAARLPHEDLLQCALELMQPQGRFAGVFPHVEGNLFVALAAGHGLHCHRRLNVKAKTHGPVKRLLLEFGQGRQPLQEETLAIADPQGGYSEGYKAHTGHFYLNF